MPGGRPSKYKPEYCDMIVEWFNIEPITFEVHDGVPVKIPAKFPTFEKFAHSIGVTHETLRAWSNDEKKPEFSVAYKKAWDLQEAVFTEGVMQGAWQQTFSIFLAKNKFGWKDKQETHHTHELGGEIKVSIIKGRE